MDTIGEVFKFLNEWWLIIGIVILLAYHRGYVFKTFIFTPLAGGNGKIQMDEMMKGIIAVMFIWAMHKDGNRTHKWPFFSDVFYASLLGAVCAIAGLKEYLRAKDIKNNEKQDNS